MPDLYIDNVLREQFDLDSDSFLRWDAKGKLVEQRPITVEERAQLEALPEPSDTDRLRARIAELEAKLVEKGVIDKADAEAVATVEVTGTEITKPGETKDDGSKDPSDEAALDSATTSDDT